MINESSTNLPIKSFSKSKRTLNDGDSGSRSPKSETGNSAADLIIIGKEHDKFVRKMMRQDKTLCDLVKKEGYDFETGVDSNVFSLEDLFEISRHMLSEVSKSISNPAYPTSTSDDPFVHALSNVMIEENPRVDRETLARLSYHFTLAHFSLVDQGVRLAPLYSFVE